MLVDLSKILAHVLPSDDPTWEKTFSYIERNHVPSDPDYWDRWLKGIAKHGIRRPITLHRSNAGTVQVGNGHHRVWAAKKLGIVKVPVTGSPDVIAELTLL